MTDGFETGELTAADGTPPPTIDLSGPAEEVEAALWAAAHTPAARRAVQMARSASW